jgi:RNA recognition motif-containing protein
VTPDCFTGIALNRGFGFVQYEQESSAVEAIKQENGAMFRGKKIGRFHGEVKSSSASHSHCSCTSL